MATETLGESLCDCEHGARVISAWKQFIQSHMCNTAGGEKFVATTGAASNEQRCFQIISKCWNNDYNGKLHL